MWFVARLALAVGALWLLARLVDPAEALAALTHADGRWLALALALMPLNIALEAYRWHRLVRRVEPSVRWRESLGAVLGGYPLGLLTPARVGEYAGRAALLRAVPAGASAALTLAEKTATLLTILAAGLVALAVHLQGPAEARSLWMVAGAVGAVWAGALAVALLRPAGTARLTSRLLPVGPIRRAADAFGAVGARESRVLIGLSALRYAVFAGQFVVLVRAFDAEAALGGVAVAKTALHAVTLGDLGVREGASVWLLGAYGVPAAAALDASLGVFVVNLLLPALAGLPLLVRARRPAARGAARGEIPAPPLPRAVPA